jgi:predicted nucleic-acid-binding protein
MIAVDTNIVVRFLTRDDESQFRQARKIFKSNEIFVPDTVILESEWVLRYAYGFGVGEICDAFGKLFGLPNVHLADPIATAKAIDWHKKGLDFSDAMHLSASQECQKLLTFDKKFSSRAKGLGKCKVLKG